MHGNQISSVLLGTNLSIECLILCMYYFYFFAIFLSGEIGKHLFTYYKLYYILVTLNRKGMNWIYVSFIEKVPIFRGFRLLVSVFTKEESSLKVIIFAMSLGKNQSRIEWQPKRQYICSILNSLLTHIRYCYGKKDDF